MGRAILLSCLMVLLLGVASRGIEASEPGAAAYGYSGREFDSSGLHYYRARYLDPRVGRFLQRDPLGLLAGGNDYRYVAANPINVIDPDGLLAKPYSRESLSAAQRDILESGTLVALRSVLYADSSAVIRQFIPRAPVHEVLLSLCPRCRSDPAMARHEAFTLTAYPDRIFLPRASLGDINRSREIGLIGHELRHLLSFEEEGEAFDYNYNHYSWLAYFIKRFISADIFYRHNPYEREAYALQRQIENTMERHYALRKEIADGKIRLELSAYGNPGGYARWDKDSHTGSPSTR